MSGKLFVQIVLLIIIASIVMVFTKVGLKCCLYKAKGKLCPYTTQQQR